MIPSAGEIYDGYRFLGGDPNDENSWERFDNKPKTGDIIEGYRFKGGNPSVQESWEPFTRPSPEIAEAQRAATAGEEYWTGGAKQPKPTATQEVEPISFAMPEEQMAGARVERGLAEARQPSITERLPAGAPVSERPLQMPIRPFQPRMDRTDALVLGELADRAKDLQLPEPTRPGPTVEAAKELERQRILDLAIQNVDSIALARDASKKLFDEYPDLGAEKEQKPLTYAALASGARFIANMGDALRMAADAGQRNLIEPDLFDMAKPQVVREIQNLAYRLFPKDDAAGKAQRLDFAEKFSKKAEELSPSILRVDFDDAWSGDRAGAWLAAKLANSSDSAALFAATLIAPQIAPITLPIIGLSSAGGTYAEDIEKGVSQQRAAINALVAGVSEPAFEAADVFIFKGAGKAVGSILGKLSAAERDALAASLAGRALKGMAVTAAASAGSGASEALTSLTQDLSTKYIAGRDPGNILKNAKESLIVGAAMGPLFTAVGAAPSAIGRIEEIGAERAAEQARQEALQKWRTEGFIQPSAPAAPVAVQAPIAPSAAQIRTMEQVREEVLSAQDVDTAISTSEQAVSEVPTRAQAAVEPQAAEPPVARAISQQEEIARRIALIEGATPAVTPVTPQVAEAPRIEAPPTGRAPVAAPEAPVEAPRVPPASMVEATAIPPVSQFSGQYRDGGKWSVSYRSVRLSDGSFALVRELTDDAGTTISHQTQDGTWAKGEPAKTRVTGATQVSGPESFPTEQYAMAAAVNDANSMGGRPTEQAAKARVEAAKTGAAESTPRAEVPGRVEAPATPAAPRIEVPPTGRVEAAATPAAPAIPAAPTFTDFTAPKANKAKGIAKGEVLTFKSQKQAAAYVKSNEIRGFTPRQTEDGWVLSKPVRERTPAQIAAARQRMRVRDDDDLLTALAKMGGLNAANLAADRVDAEDMKSINKGSVLKPFRRTGGMSLDGAAEAMAGMGYDVYDESGRVDATKAREILNEAIMGEKVYSPQGYEILASRNAEEQAQMEAEKEAEAIAITEAMPAMAQDELLAAAAIPREAPIEVPAPAEIPAGAVRLEEPVPGEFIVATPVVQQENLDQAFAQAETQVRQGSTAQYENAEPTYEPTGPSDQPAARVSEPSPEYAVRRRGGLVQLRAGGFYQTLGEQGHLGLVGQRVDSPAKLAELAQIYRNPGYETFRVFFTDQDGRIVEQTGASARLPGQANFIGVTDGTQIFSDWIQSRMEKNNAEGFYILHNHPSGDPTPSQQDADATRAVATNGFLGHIVINGNRYAKIDANGEYELLPLQTFSTQDPVRRQLMQNGVIGTPIAADADVAKIGRLFTTSEDMSVVMAQGNTGVTAIGEIPNQTLLDPQRGPAAIRRFARFNGGAQIFVYTQPANRINPNVVRLYDQGFVTDVVSGNGNSIVAERGFSPNQGTFGGTRTRPIRQLGEERAIQEPSAAEVPVREGARGGETMGERDAQRQEAAREGRVGEAGPEEVAQPLPPYSAQLSRWFSELERQISQGPESMPAAQWKGWIANRKTIKPDEIFWTGINDFLDLQTGKVSKQQIQDFLKENGVRVAEVELGGPFFTKEDQVALAKLQRQRIDQGQSMPEADLKQLQYLERLLESPKPRYKQHTLPGGENYREVLLTLPDRGHPMTAEVRALGITKPLDEVTGNDIKDAGGTSDQAARWMNSITGTTFGGRYKSPHWSQTNVLAHIRVNDRTDADGKRVLFVEEIQSDWGQEGKKRGFAAKDEDLSKANLVATAVERGGESVWIINTAGGKFVTYITDIPTTSGNEERAIVAARVIAQRQADILGGVPAAPFVTKTEGWLNLALKKVMIMAAEGGYDRVAFINGQQSADRYDLSKQVDSIVYAKESDGSYSLVAMKDGMEAVKRDAVAESALPDLVGKEVADRIIKGEGKSLVGGPEKELTGENLKVGGEGMKAFYDQIVPSAVKKLLPKVGGGQIATVDVSVEKQITQAEVDAAERRRDFDEAERLTRIMERQQLGRGTEEVGAKTTLQQSGFDVTPKMREFVGGGMPLFQPLAPYEAGGNTVKYSINDPTNLELVQRTLQDRLVDLKKVENVIQQTNGPLIDALVPSLQAELYSSRTAQRNLAFNNFELMPLEREIARRGLTQDEVEEYLHARHAPSRNKVMARRNPNAAEIKAKIASIEEAIKKAKRGSPEIQQLRFDLAAWKKVEPFKGTEEERLSLSGMSTQAAQEYLASLQGKKKADLEAVGKMVDSIVNKTKKILIDGGVDGVDSFNEEFEFYVPLYREGMEEQGGGFGQGFNIKGKTTRMATGSKRTVVDILAAIATARYIANNRVEKNRVANSMVGLAQTVGDNEIWSVELAEKEPVIDDRTGTVKMRPKRGTGAFTARIPDGKGGVIEHAIYFNQNNATAKQIEAAMKGIDVEQLNIVAQIFQPVTRWFANVNTQWNPIFGAVNFTRDLQSSIIQTADTPIADKRTELVKRATLMIPSLFSEFKAQREGRTTDSEAAKLLRDFQERGGQTAGFRGTYSREEEALRMQKHIRRLGNVGLKGMTYRQWESFKSVTGYLIADYNNTLENAIRLSAYQLGLEKGLTKDRAALMAKDITVNFDRKGTATRSIGALYAFFNPAVQQIERMGRLFEVSMTDKGIPKIGKRGQKIVGSLVMLGVAQAVAFALSDIGEDEVKEFVKEKNFVLPIGFITDKLPSEEAEEFKGKPYLTFPLALGYNFFVGLGRIMGEYVFSGFKDAKKRMTQVLGLAVDSFNPLGSASLAQMVAPTAVDPSVALIENKDWLGNNIYKENYDKFSQEPGWMRARDNASKMGVMVAMGTNWFFTGGPIGTGSIYVRPSFSESDIFSPTPDQIDYLVGQITGGIGRESIKLAKTIEAQFTGEELPAHARFLTARFYGEAKPLFVEGDKFYKNIKLMDEYKREIEGREEAGIDPGEYISKHPEAIMYTEARGRLREVQELRKLKREKVAAGADKQEIRDIEYEITSLMADFNNRIDSYKE